MIRFRRAPQRGSDSLCPRRHVALWCSSAIALLVGCDFLNMYDQPHLEPLEASRFFANQLSARPLVEGTVPRGGLRDDEHLYFGHVGKRYLTELPDAAYQILAERQPLLFSASVEAPTDAEKRSLLLSRGRERFDIFCSVCHGRTGDGQGMIVRRGFVRPPSYHEDRLRAAPIGHLFDVATTGLGAMPAFANRIDVEDRWAIVAYIRALQLCQNAKMEDVPPDERAKFAAMENSAAHQPDGNRRESP